MENLVALGLVEATVDKPRRYQATEIPHSIQTLAQKITQRSEEITAESKQIVTRLEDLSKSARTQTKPSMHITTGYDHIEKEFVESLERTKSEVWIAMGSAQLSRAPKSFIGNLNKAIAARNIGMRAIVEADRASNRSNKLGCFSKPPFLSPISIVYYCLSWHLVHSTSFSPITVGFFRRIRGRRRVPPACTFALGAVVACGVP